MSNEVKRYCCFDPFNGSEELFGEFEVVLATDYAALEAENARLREERDSFQRVGIQAAEERDAALAKLAAIQGGMGEVVEVVAWMWRDLNGDVQFNYMHPEGQELMTVAQHQRIVAAMAAELEQARGEISDLHTTMMAAAVEIQEQWSAHCDEEGYGPANLMHRLEHGIASQYGYTAETLVRTEARLEALRAELEAARKQEHCAEIIEGWRIVFAGAGPILPIVERHGLKIGSKLYALPPMAGKVSVPDVCDGREQEAFEAFAKREGMDTSMHPLHWLFLNRETYAARQGWKAAIRYCRALLATPSMEVKHDA